MRRTYVLFLCLMMLFSCKSKWTDQDKNDFYSGCMSNAVVNKDVKDPKAYCSCLLQKIVAKYPDAGDAKYIRYDSTVKQLAKDCLQQRR